MTPEAEEFSQIFKDWAVNDVYNHWEIFALNASIAVYDYATIQAREESDRRIAKTKEYVEDLVKYYKLVSNGKTEEKDPLVYTPKQEKDMR